MRTNKGQEKEEEKCRSKTAFYFVVAGEEMWKFNCWRVSLQLSNFIYLFFFLVSFLRAGRPLGNISIIIFFFFFFFLETCLWLALRAREKEEEGGTGWFIARNWQLQQFWQLTQKRKTRLAALLFCFFDSLYFFTDVSVQPPSTSLRSFLSFG